MKKEQKVWAITLIAFGWLAPNLVLSQQDSLRTTQLPEVVITASKFAKSKRETGKVITVISADQLNFAAGKDLAQVLNEQVGLVINGANSNAGKDKSVYLRGAKSEYTLILVDGIPLTDPSSVSGGAYDLRLLSLDQVERIEIMKGSQSTLYGSDAVAGVINIITKSESEKPIGANARIGYGTYNTFQATAGLAGYVKDINYRIGYSRFSTDGLSEAKETGAGSFDNDGSSQDGLTANFNIETVKNLSIRPFIRYTRFTGQYDAGAFTDDTQNRYKGTLFNTGGLIFYKFNKGTLQTQYTFDETNRLFDGTYGKSEYTGKFNHLEIFGDYQINKPLRVLAGASKQDYKMLDKTSAEIDPRITIYSLYAALTGSWNNFSVETGARFNHHSRFGGHTTYSVNPAYVYRKHKLFINLSTGFKAPSLYQLYGQYGANPHLKPERSQSMEAGISGLLYSNKIEWQVVYFNRSIQDVVVYTNGTNNNLDKQDDHGTEAELTIHANKRFKVRTWYTYVTGQVTTKTPAGDTTFYNLIRRPKHAAGINLSYGISDKWKVSSFLQVIGTRTDLYFDLTTFSNKSANLEAYTLLDVSIQYQASKNFELFFSGRNLFNTQYQEVYGYNTLGLTASGGLHVNF
ncbi:MAG: TonB-dependent receptor [Bacteroidetes bacterium CHB5]|nr:TonB-dependent receptor [Bacteroidetes bacterium CHB5]